MVASYGLLADQTTEIATIQTLRDLYRTAERIDRAEANNSLNSDRQLFEECLKKSTAFRAAVDVNRIQRMIQDQASLLAERDPTWSGSHTEEGIAYFQEKVALEILFPMLQSAISLEDWPATILLLTGVGTVASRCNLAFDKALSVLTPTQSTGYSSDAEPKMYRTHFGPTIKQREQRRVVAYKVLKASESQYRKLEQTTSPKDQDLVKKEKSAFLAKLSLAIALNAEMRATEDELSNWKDDIVHDCLESYAAAFETRKQALLSRVAVQKD